MSQILDDAQYRLELCQERARNAELLLNKYRAENTHLATLVAEARSTIVAQEVALQIYRQDADLWHWMDLAAAAKHTQKAEVFVDWYDKTGLIGTRNRKDSLQGAFAKAVQ